MTKLATEQLLYLLYAVAYSAEGSVTKGVVRGHLPEELRKNAEEVYESLCKQNLIRPEKRNRLVLSQLGNETLVSTLTTTEYRFNSQKGPKVLNALLDCFKFASVYPPILSEEMDFDTFTEKLKKIYFEERKHQELRGVVAIHSQEIRQKFSEQNQISQEKLNQYFDLLKVKGKILAMIEKDNELIQWVE
ncbi:MAG: hypothetical protein HC851_16935 [Acaryochloris sp. RU_4_1]|nr:hypothetical protein [Acaryochloris sp. RU_4_1]NJR55963.1 hypothetical protein [Acaryochloris sp. CRU_2_0]